MDEGVVEDCWVEDDVFELLDDDAPQVGVDWD
jgi:hypothetical protein